MADKIDVDVTGKSKYEVAQAMAIDILFRIEKKTDWDKFNRKDYLHAVAEAMDALHGIHR